MLATAHSPASPAGSFTDFRDQLKALIRLKSFKRGRFVLSSGAESELYFNLKPTMMDPEGAYLSARALLAEVDRLSPDFVGGLEMGAVPAIAALAAISHSECRPVATFFVRKERKTHGAGLLIEGLSEGQSLAGKSVLIADDVATSGKSILKAVEAARAEGARVDHALVLVDRDEGGGAFLSEHGVLLHAVFKGSEF
jgi:orotate phosphoribosyltransferase